MRSRLQPLLFLCVLAYAVIAWRPPEAAQPRKRALIIAIGDYPRAGGYRRLNSANDVPLVRRALERQHFDDIVVVSDRQATRAAIVSAFHDLAARAAPDDIVLIHYSGHGHQITDDNGDEIDGYDELLVPADAPNVAVINRAGYRGELHIRDDDVGELLRGIRRKVGSRGSVVVTVDACFSGSIARALADSQLAPIRGEPMPMGPPAPGGGTGERSALQDLLAGEHPDMGRLVVITAARDDEVDREINNGENWVGPLSQALAGNLDRMRAGDSYRTVFSRIQTNMRAWVPAQHPQIEGTPDLVVFGGAIVEQAAHMEVATARGDRVLWVPAGIVAGVHAGSEVSFYPAGTTRPGLVRPIAQGIVREARGLASRAELTPPAPAIESLNGTWAYVTRWAAAQHPVRALVMASASDRIRALARTAVEATTGSAVLVDAEADAAVGFSPGHRDSLAVLIPAGPQYGDSSLAAVLGPVHAAETDTALAIANRLRAMLRHRDLLTLPLNSPSLSVGLVLKPALLRLGPTGCSPDTLAQSRARHDNGVWRAYATPGGSGVSMPEFLEGYVLEMRNQSSEDLWVSVLDLTPSMGIRILYPAAGESAQSNRLPARQNHVIPACFAFSQHTGSETLLMIATRAPADFRLLETQREPGARSNLDALSKLLADAYHGTRTNPPPVDATAGTMATLLLQILPSPRPQ